MSIKRNAIMANKRNLFTIIQQNNVEFREYLGDNRTKLSPRFNIDLPFFHFTRVIPLCEIKLDINEISCYAQDNVPVTIDGTLYVKVNELEKSVL